MSAQRGFLLAGPALYIAGGAAGALILGLGFALWLNGLELNSCHKSLAAAEQQLVTLEDKLDEQNKAVENLEKESQARQKAAVAALERARRDSKALDVSRGQLKAAMGKKPVSDCPARDGVKEIRRSLG